MGDKNFVDAQFVASLAIVSAPRFKKCQLRIVIPPSGSPPPGRWPLDLWPQPLIGGRRGGRRRAHRREAVGPVPALGRWAGCLGRAASLLGKGAVGVAAGAGGRPVGWDTLYVIIIRHVSGHTFGDWGHTLLVVSVLYISYDIKGILTWIFTHLLS